MDTFLGIPIIRILVYWGPLILGNYLISMGCKICSIHHMSKVSLGHDAAEEHVGGRGCTLFQDSFEGLE